VTPEEAYARRKRMVAEQIEARGIAEPAVLSAMRTVPREAFVPAAQAEQAYEDRPLPIGHDQTISQPYVVAAMSEALEVGAGDAVLEVGAGCGYQAAVLAEIASEVVTIEVVPALAEAARERLARLRYDHVSVHVGDGADGWPERAPYAGILVACGAPDVPPALLEQLAPGGKLVIPVGPPGGVMDLVVASWEDGRLRRRTLMPVRFVPLVTG